MSKIIVALDFNQFEEAKQLIDKTKDLIEYYKVGLESYISCGEKLLNYIQEQGKKIFLDLKFHDIPNTVSSATVASLKYNVDIVNMHTQGGIEMMSNTVKMVTDYCNAKNIKKPKIIGVTLLTSLDLDYMKNHRINFDSTEEYVLHLARNAKISGLDGVVSSPKETVIIKENLGKDFITITPGIRPAYEQLGDQKRVMTPKEAKITGTDFMVIGRPITKAADPQKAVLNILEELND
ncbi:MAG: orotidine-5'-phosphate decarboxylase [Calditerrivibrio sp.]|nr:orotidine-5'-phosphate decarboxylase [Calditerrivibrio sp.]MCA1933460.1 orotidine-5'-phosphate decarboxylase [Calditerrivibrio sp.]MCA1980225.1 orotidine-5'-phosphate decarboxylase [Calditerrivibrio sp.]